MKIIVIIREKMNIKNSVLDYVKYTVEHGFNALLANLLSKILVNHVGNKGYIYLDLCWSSYLVFYELSS